MRVYVLFDQITMQWKDARDMCRAGNGTLLSVENQSKLDDILYMDRTFWKNRM